MANDKKQNAMMLDPNRFRINKEMAIFPGGPENNNALNVTSIADPAIQADSIMGDHRQQYPQMGTGSVNPQGIRRSQVPHNMPMGRGKNAGAPFGMQMQPSGNAQEPMEGMRLGSEAAQKGLTANPFMGVTGSPALMPGAMDPTMPGTSSPLGVMPTMQQVVGGEMIPGSTPQKIQKKGKK
jgi:hypothetical protein